jgi:hypothetical protein
MAKKRSTASTTKKPSTKKKSNKRAKHITNTNTEPEVQQECSLMVARAILTTDEEDKLSQGKASLLVLQRMKKNTTKRMKSAEGVLKLARDGVDERAIAAAVLKVAKETAAHESIEMEIEERELMAKEIADKKAERERAGGLVLLNQRHAAHVAACALEAEVKLKLAVVQAEADTSRANNERQNLFHEMVTSLGYGLSSGSMDRISQPALK